MDYTEKLEYIIELEKTQKELQQSLKEVNQQIDIEQEICEHICVNLGFYNNLPKLTSRYCCLICGKGKKNIFYEPKYVVNAENYLTYMDIQNAHDMEEKLNTIRKITINVLKESSSMDREELVNKLNYIINEKDRDKTEQIEEPKMMKKVLE